MEELYRSIIPDATIHSIDWSSLNLLAVSSSITKAGFVGEGFGSLKTHQLLVFDANRPWQYYSVYNDNKSITCEVKWSQDGLRLLSVEQDGVARVWKMKVTTTLHSAFWYMSLLHAVLMLFKGGY
jgi:WD40 repeat protein